uniref:Thymidylate kinase n=1 Tax=Blastobotrys adeninivorans TaxID=409370 RepID=A0A060THF9_BLAAD
MSRGSLILIEGLDRAGKSTQCERLKDRIGATLLKFPDRTTPIGKMINDYLTNSSDLSDEAIHLLFSANRWEAKKTIEDLIYSGRNVVVDRYVYSGVAFSAAKLANLNLEWCLNPDKGLPYPDVTIFLDVSEEVAKQRGGYGEERYEKLEFQRKVRHIFKDQLRRDDWIVISADASVDEVADKIYDAVKDKVDRLDDRLGVF